MCSHSHCVEQCTWYLCLIKHTGDVTELEFSSMGLDSCHHTFLFMPHLETLLNETFVLSSFITHGGALFSIISAFYCWSSHFMLAHAYSCILFPSWRSWKVFPLRLCTDCVKGGPKPFIVQSAMQSLALQRGCGHSLRRAKDWHYIGCSLSPTN